MAEIEKYFNLKFTKIFIIIIFVISFIILLILDLIRLLEVYPIDEIIIIKIRDVYFANDVQSVFFYCFMIILGANIIIGIKIQSKFKKILNQRDENSKISKMLKTTVDIFCIARIIEMTYLLFASDFKYVYEVIFQSYITLDVLACVILIMIASILFLDEKKVNNPKIVLYLIAFLISSVFIGYLITVIYAVFPSFFIIGSIIGGAFIVIDVIIAGFILVRIINFRKIPVKNKNIMLFLGFQLIFSIFSIFLMIPLGLTFPLIQEGIFLPNRVLRLIRLIILAISIFTYNPAYIRPFIKKYKI